MESIDESQIVMVDKEKAINKGVYDLEWALRYDNPDGCGEEGEDPPEREVWDNILFHPY